MIEMFKSLGIGLAVAVFVIFILLTAYFQSPRLAGMISIGAVPGVLAGSRPSSTSPTPRSTSSRSWARSCA